MLRLGVLRVLGPFCVFGFGTGHFVMVSLNLACIHCLQHFTLYISSIYIIYDYCHDCCVAWNIISLITYIITWVCTYVPREINHHIFSVSLWVWHRNTELNFYLIIFIKSKCTFCLKIWIFGNEFCCTNAIPSWQTW